MTTITIEQFELKQLLVEAARQGANLAIEDMAVFHMKDACKRLGMSYNTLQKRIQERKIRLVDGRITGAELRRYLTEFGRNT